MGSITTKRRLHRGVRCAIMIALILAFALVPSVPVAAQHRDHTTHIDRADVDLELHRDGTVDIVETLTYHVAGKIHEMTYDLRFPSEGESQLTSLSVARIDHGQLNPFIDVPEYDPLRTQPLAYATTWMDDRARIRMTTTAIEHDVVVRIAYRWDRGIVYKEGRALLSGNLLTVPPGTPIDTMSWTIKAPSNGILSLHRAVTVSPIAMTEVVPSERSLRFVANEPFYSAACMGLMITMPAQHFPSIGNATDTTSLQTLTDSARERAKACVRAETFRQALSDIAWPLFVVGIVTYLLFVFWQNIRFRPMPSDVSHLLTASPPVVAKMARFGVRDPQMLVATLLRLVNHREVEWTGELFIWRNPDRNDFSQFTPWETFLLQWLFAYDATYDHVLAPERIRVEARRPDFRELAQQFTRQIDRALYDAGFLNRRATLLKRIFFALYTLVFVAMAIAFYSVSSDPLAFILLVPAVLFGTGTFFIRLKTPAGIRFAWQTRRLRKRIGDVEALMQAPTASKSDIERVISALPIAVAMNRQKEFFNGIRALPRPMFERAAYGLLHVYRRLPFPATRSPNLATDHAHVDALTDDLNEMERVLAAWTELFGSCFI